MSPSVEVLMISVLSLLGPQAPAAVPALPIALDVQIDAETQELSFALRHHGTEPIRVFADRGLLSVVLSAEGNRRPLRCSAPAAARPRRIEPDRIIELGGGESYEERIALRYFCWGKKYETILSNPYRLSARYGFPGAASGRPIAWGVGDMAAQKVASLSSDARVMTTVPAAAPAVPPNPLRLDVRASYVDSAEGRQVPVALRIVNQAAEPVLLFVHPRQFRFEVTGREGTVECALFGAEIEPSREAYRRLAPREGVSMSLDVAQYCPEGTFDFPGVYGVRPVFEPSHDAARIGLRALTGRFAGRPLLVRVTVGALVSYLPQGASQ